MHIVFISYWGIDQGLSKSTVLPHIEVLARDVRVNSISLITFERESFETTIESDQFKHIPIDESAGIRGINKFSSIRRCYQILKSEQPNLVIARSSLAGIAAYHYHKKTGTPYIVESFEPHTDYMIDSGEWKANGFKTRLLNRYEKNIKKTAAFLLPVAHQYKSKLITEGVAEKKIIVMPCTVDQKQFAFDEVQRNKVRNALKIGAKSTVGIYVGKFGGLYQKDQAFKTFEFVGKQFNSFEMIILSPTDKDEIEQIAIRNNYPTDHLHILSVQQYEVPAYLSASDISFATYKSFESNRYLSPIKIGEYWAAGLFVCITENVGDDSKIIETENIGSIIEKKENIREKLSNFKRENAVNSAIKYRSRKLISEAYDQVFKNLN